MKPTPARDWREALAEAGAASKAGEAVKAAELVKQALALCRAEGLAAGPAGGPSPERPDLAAAAEEILNLPGASDPLPALRKLAEQAEALAAEEGAASGPATWQSFGELGRLYGGDPPPIPWLVDKTFSRRTAAMLAADGAVGKTWLALDLALAVAEGPERGPTRILGYTLPPDASGPAVVLTAEDDTGEIHRRLHTLDPTGERRRRAEGRLFVLPMPDLAGAARPVPIALEDRQSDRRFELGPEFLALVGWLHTVKPALVVFDPLAALSWLEPNDNAAGGFLMGTLNHLAAELDALVVMTHHLRKSSSGGINARRDRVRGASALVNESRAVFVLQEVAPDLAAEFIADRNQASPERGLATGDLGAVIVGELCKSNAPAHQGLRFFARGKDGRLYNVKTEFAAWFSKRRWGMEDEDVWDFARDVWEGRRVPDEFGGPPKPKPKGRGAGNGEPKGSPKGNGARSPKVDI